MNPEEKPTQEKPVEMNPRTKDGQGLDYWAAGLYSKGLISKNVYEHFIYVNSHKEEEMEKRGLPQLKHYGFFKSIDDLSKFLDTKHGNEKFIIRCSNGLGDIKRLLDSTAEEVIDYAKNLPGGFDSWKVELKEFTETKEAGTLIIDSKGDVVMESWKGPHFHVSLNGPKIVCYYNHDDFIPKYKWSIPSDMSAYDIELMQERMLKIIKQFAPNLKPEENNQLYLEYGIKPDNSFYAIEANDSLFLTDGISSNKGKDVLSD